MQRVPKPREQGRTQHTHPHTLTHTGGKTKRPLCVWLAWLFTILVSMRTQVRAGKQVATSKSAATHPVSFYKRAAHTRSTHTELLMKQHAAVRVNKDTPTITTCLSLSRTHAASLWQEVEKTLNFIINHWAESFPPNLFLLKFGVFIKLKCTDAQLIEIFPKLQYGLLQFFKLQILYH